MPEYNPRVTDEERAEIRRLHAEGHGRNEIARRIGRGTRTVSIIAEAYGLTFDRTRTAIATEARVIDAKARRAALVQRAYARAEKLFQRLEADEDGGFTYTATTINGIETEHLDHVPGQEEKALAASISSYLTQAARLEQIDGDPGLDAARSMLGGLAEGLRRIAEAPEDTGEG